MDINEAIELLKEKGYKTTGKRKEILSFFADADGYRTAKDLIQYLESSYDGISFDTVYRNLHLYNEIGILETTELNGEKHFRINCTHHHHHHFICKDCGKTKEIKVCPMDEVEQALADYAIEGHKFEIYGRCPGCKLALT
ncbi:MAG: Fur family transcriptional regulator [Bacillota bacterium]|uniref:Transcriptional repressor n=1 Tax=Virgibacillus salarius TaxID=447199 RepID=A0A941I9L8_9BACI|nr:MULTISPECIES: Fur family transcriptional regulator [Bacillaceae]NAZ07184.1 transcriptional repressor [Agaribacter marinus]MBR7794461.1 transcriptional repressor [Virgibacillus salarius]MCC2248796.1 transcriptional repressor [Virgibacillus sp. AGTR]MDY7043255.1 Fur family transcriptional regulator [Virgibacillus sp. M23]QRZ17915.1 transcriptional repressor [Virgibacillus sp. AGTR]